MAKTFCVEQHCPLYAETKSSRCTEHRKVHINQWNKEKRDPAHVSFYQSVAWKTARETKLDAEPVCQICADQPATQVHHVQQLSAGGHRTDASNLQSTCASCHAIESARERKEKKSKGIPKK